MSETPRIVVAGAGAVGCLVGGFLTAAGRDVTFLGRDRLAAEVAEHGLTFSDLDGRREVLETPDFRTDPSCLGRADVVLVAVKSLATGAMAATIKRYAPKALVVSLQNGISNPDILRETLVQGDVRGGVVGFNVVQEAPGAFHRATSGEIWVEDTGNGLAGILSVPGLDVKPVPDIRPVQWGKLLVNLNNAPNALSGLTLLEQLGERTWRRVLAAQMQETLRVLRAERISPARFSPVAPGLVPHILRLPTPLFRRIARSMISIDPKARLSMQDDLRRGRKTEIDALQGEVLRLAASHRLHCPVIAKVVAAVKLAEEAADGPPGLDAKSLF